MTTAVEYYEQLIANCKENTCGYTCDCHGVDFCLIPPHDSTHAHVGLQANGELIQWTCEVRDAEQPAE